MDRQQAAKEEMQNRQYLYGGLRPITGPFVGERREILSPEMNINMGPTLGGGLNIQTIPAEYGPVEYDSSYAPVNRGLSALNDLFFGDANEQAAVVNQAGSALKNVLTSMPEYFSDQVTAVASGGEYFDPDTNQITQFDPTILLAGGNPAASGGITLGSGIRAPSKSASRNFGGPIPEVTRDTELLQRIGDPKSVNEMTVEMTDPVISQAPLITAEDLIDRPFITGMSDTSRSGLETVTSVNNVPLNAVMRGGKYFGLQPENLKRNIAFASAPRAVTGQLNRAEAAQALGDRPVAFIPFGMRPESPDFATMSTDIMVPYAQKVMSKADKKILDKRIRTGSGTKKDDMAPIPDWIGIDKATPEYLANLGGARKSVTKALDEFSSESRAITKDSGSLNKSQVRAIVTDPKQFSPRFGDIDMIYELDPTAVANKSFLQSDHPSYTAALQGRPLGALKDNGKANIFDFNPLAGTTDTGFYDFRQKQLDAGRDFEIGGLLDSPTMKAFLPGGHGIITREMVDELIRKGLIKP